MVLRRVWMSFLLVSVPVPQGRYSGVFAEILTEETCVGEVQVLGDLLDREVGGAEEVFGFCRHHTVYPIGRRVAGFFLDGCAEVARGHTHLVGVISECALAFVVAEHVLHKLPENHVLTARNHFRGVVGVARNYLIDKAVQEVLRHEEGELAVVVVDFAVDDFGEFFDC